MVMTVWSMLLVEVVHPLVKELDIAECSDCAWGTTSVMGANLLLFKTVIAGDSWGDMAVPVIEAHWYTSFVFVGSYLTIVFGVLNLVVAVVEALLEFSIWKYGIFPILGHEELVMLLVQPLHWH